MATSGMDQLGMSHIRFIEDVTSNYGDFDVSVTLMLRTGEQLKGRVLPWVRGQGSVVLRVKLGPAQMCQYCINPADIVYVCHTYEGDE